MRHKGFTIVEVVVGSSIMLIIMMLTLTLYTKSNKTAVDQMQLAEIQHDARSGIYFISEDVKNAGVGLPSSLSGCFVEGIDGYGPAPEFSDSIKIMGGFDGALELKIEKYLGGAGGGASTAFLYAYDLENFHYSLDFYIGKVVLLASTICPDCYAFRVITNAFGLDGIDEPRFNMSPGLSAGLNPPGGLIESCKIECWKDAEITFGQIKQYWLDTTGIPGDYPDLNLTVGQAGYQGIPYVLYMTTVYDGVLTHMPIALNIENLQFQYIFSSIMGDLDFDGLTDASADWDNFNWTINPADDLATQMGKLVLLKEIRLVRMWMLGKTANPFVGVSGTSSTNIHLYRRPAIANSPMSDQDDRHRRFLVETTSNIRNRSLNFYSYTYFDALDCTSCHIDKEIYLEDATLKVIQIRKIN